jgi:mRNA-degrading endonuclease toxin of MazEF toxin-antitoxin module
MGGPKQGEIYRLKRRGAEGKARPVLVVSRNELNRGHSLLVIPFYSQQLDKRASLPWCRLFHVREGDSRRSALPRPTN